MAECKICGSGENVDEHHTSYEPEETVMLCRSCHQTVHGNPDHRLHPEDSGKKTVIEIDEELRDWLREIREPPESSYSDTLRRLRNEDNGRGFPEDRVRELVRDEVRMEALE